MTEMRIQTKQWSCLSEPTLHIAESMIAVLFLLGNFSNDSKIQMDGFELSTGF